jgi:hypothetical protein
LDKAWGVNVETIHIFWNMGDMHTIRGFNNSKHEARTEWKFFGKKESFKSIFAGAPSPSCIESGIYITDKSLY